jgi:hypothetical protein
MQWWHQHARGGSLGAAIHDLYGESTNKTGGRVWIALYVKKQLKVIFNIPRFTIEMNPNLRFYGTTTVRSNYITVKVIPLSWLFGRNTCKVVLWRYNKARINCNGLLNLSNEIEKKKQWYFHMQWNPTKMWHDPSDRKKFYCMFNYRKFFFEILI